MEPLLEANRRRWDELVPIHAASRFYDVEGFLAGDCSLLPIEREEVGDVRSKSLLHLQCHFGLDTLSWARRGARVTGVDFSSAGIAKAKELAARASLEARFVESEATRAGEALAGEQFDVVFTSWGVLCWLPDLEPWARTAASLVKPGGTFYIAEIHPIILLYDQPGTELRRVRSYFRQEEPLVGDDEGSYADPAAKVVNTREYCWTYELGQVITALCAAGLRIEYVREYDATCCAIAPTLVEGPDRMFRLPEGSLSLPLSFSIRATRDFG